MRKLFNKGSIVLKDKTCYIVGDTFLEKGKTKYKVRCVVCSGDKDLFPNGANFVTTSRVLNSSSSYSCPCSSSYKGWNTKPLEILVRRVVPHTFTIDFLGKSLLKPSSEIRIQCACGEQKVKTITYLRSKNIVCTSCGDSKRLLIRNKEETFIADILKRDGFFDFKWEDFSGKVKDSKFSYSCICGNVTTKTCTQFRTNPKASCIFCGKNTSGKRRTHKEFTEDATSFCKSRGVEFLKWEESIPKDTLSKFMWKCFCGKINKTSFNNFKRGGGCRSCASKTRTFKGSGYLYISLWELGKESVIKFGITKNPNPILRVNCFGRDNVSVGSLLSVDFYKFYQYETACTIEDYLKGTFVDLTSPISGVSKGKQEVVEGRKLQEVKEALGYFLWLSNKSRSRG